MNKERYFIWKNYEKLQELVDSINTSGESTDSPEDIENDEEEGEGE